jgi:pullulanase
MRRVDGMGQTDLRLRTLRGTHFVLWRPRHTDVPPRLVLATLTPGGSGTLAGEAAWDLAPAPDLPGLWWRAAADCGLVDGQVYHYWFEVTDSRPDGPGGRVRRTDPAAGSVDWRVLSPLLPSPYGAQDRWPAAVVSWRGGRLLDCDPDGGTGDWSDDVGVASLAPNNRTVVYKLPTRWSRSTAEGGVMVGTGTFADVRALIEPAAAAPGFAGVPALAAGAAYLAELGVTTLELTPIADSWLVREWGYATSNYFAPDHDLGFPATRPAPAAGRELAALVTACHRAGVRFGYDAVMGFAQRDPYREINFLDFHVWWTDPDAVDQSHLDPEQDGRNGWGGDLWKYGWRDHGYDPLSGTVGDLYPARQHMLAHLTRWILDHRVDSVRIDSVNTVANYDFVATFTATARELARQRAVAAGGTADVADARFLVYGEEIESFPVAELVGRGRLDGLQNERFKTMIRAAVLGLTDWSSPDFAEMVRRMIDCRRLGFADGAQAVNYVTSHDVGGPGNQRLYNYLVDNGVPFTEARIKLAFACLLTAVGIPLILAGEEFADQHDLPLDSVAGKQLDPVNFERREEPWRRRVFDHVARLVRLRQRAPALAVNDTAFLHQDFSDGRRVLAWRRGGPDQDPVVVVANFSDWGSDPTSEYVVPNWPATPPGRSWREVTRDRPVPAEWVGREPLYPWEAKVYTLVEDELGRS